MTANRTSTEVLVIGGGPMGLATAIGLRLAGVACTVVERHASTLDFPRGRGISVRSMEVFRQWGVEQQLLSRGLPRGESLFAFSGRSLLGAQFQRVAEPPAETAPSPTDRLICDQAAMEEVLRDRAADLGADLRFGLELTGFSQDEHGVQAIARSARGGEEHLDAQWLVGADGARSTVRTALGISRSGPGTVSRAVSVLFTAEPGQARLAGRAAAIYRISDLPGGSLLAVDNARRWLLIYAYDPAVDGPETLTHDRCAALARTAVGDAEVPVEVLGTRFWESAVLISDRYRCGRVLLAGDAAHVVTPIGGLGMNCGIADAHNLTWKLAGVVHGWATPSLLDTYEHERRPVALQTGAASLGPARPPAPTRGVDLGHCYRSEAVLPDDEPAPPPLADPVAEYVPSGRPGCRAPHLWLEGAPATSTLDVLGGGFVLLVDAAGAGAGEAAVAACADTGIPLRVHVVHDLAWRDLYGLAAAGAVLVRPDGHVAWRTQGLHRDPQQLRDVLLRAVVRG